MKAIVCLNYGPPETLQLTHIEKPTPGPAEVLVKVVAASLNAADWHMMRGEPKLMRLAFGFSKPKIKALGADVAGVVEAVGANVKELAIGDEVFGDLSGCGFGAFAEYVCAPEKVLIRKPKNLSLIECAAVPMAAMTALKGLREVGALQAGQRVLIVGASSGVGSFATQIASALGAEVTAVGSPAKIEFVRGLGAQHVIDNSRQDVIGQNTHYDLIFDTAAYRSFLDYRRILKPKGRYVLVGGSMRALAQTGFLGFWVGALTGQKFHTFVSIPSQEMLRAVVELIEGGNVRPMVGARYSLEEVPAAIGAMEQRQICGKVVVVL